MRIYLIVPLFLVYLQVKLISTASLLGLSHFQEVCNHMYFLLHQPGAEANETEEAEAESKMA